MPNRPSIEIVRAMALATAILVSIGPAMADRRGDQSVRDQEIEQLKERNLRLRQQAAMDRVEIERLRQEVERLQAALGDARTPALTAPVEAEPRGPVVRPGPRIESSELEEPPAPTRVPVPPPATAAGGAGGDLQAIYDEGYTLFHQERYDEAEARFKTFLAGSGDSDLADNAQFWVGECRFARGDFQSALTAFTDVVDRFPKGNKVPDAMIKAGKTLEALGDRDAARATYREVQSRFPGTAAEATAAELLGALD